jgi:hypothetical protein
MNTFVNTKVLHDTFVQLFVFRASGVIALCRRSHSGGAKKGTMENHENTDGTGVERSAHQRQLIRQRDD